ncbi:LysR substrate-binding domain-containing protein [Paraburkholderia diazotrophica]|uniref:LysR substrate-binding domain-containing protein n=1 Tax=Paraburkholderia diazotrophica TaxID=667676 RepID=UPI00317FD0FB
MPRANLHDLIAFVAVARERSFTKAAAQLGISQSTLSHKMRTLEERMGLRLLTRTTRSVSTTDAGERLLQSLSPHFEQIDAEVEAVVDLREKPSGIVRITATDYAANTVIWPKIAKVLPQYPDIKIELSIDYALRDIVADRFDIGVRSGDQVARDMIAVRIAPPFRMAIVGSPTYLRNRAPVELPEGLLQHNCINLRLPTHGGLLPWELKKKTKEVQVRVEGQVTVTNTYQMIEAAVAGFGLAYVPEDLAQPFVDKRRLRWVLQDWWPTYPGLHAYYPGRRQTSRALQVVIDALRRG